MFLFSQVLSVIGPEHDNGVVDGHADGEGDAGERNDVDGAVENEEAEEGGDGADGNAHHADEGEGNGPEEEEHHDGGQNGAEGEVSPDVGDGVLYVDDVVVEELHAHAGRVKHLAVDLFDGRDDGFADGEGMTSESVLVLNTAPTSGQPFATGMTLTETDTLTCMPRLWDDVDGDPQGFLYSWTIDGLEVATTMTATGTVFEKGDAIICCTCLLYTSPSPRDRG